jgi:Protein of unknown function (DUF3187)
MMKWISFLIAIMAIFYNAVVFADAPPSYRQQHPLASMHALPVGEQPGWSDPWWINFEASVGNVWNAPLVMNDRRNGKQYQYTADFEQNNYILEVGAAITDRLAASLELPFADRGGGALDGFIDSFHVLLGNRRFNRQYYPEYQDIFSVKTDGVDFYNQDELGDGLANVKLKLKFWLAQWMGQQKGSCPCGVAVSSQTKIPTQPEKFGGTTGDIDQSVLLHFGAPLFSASAVWFTAGYTWLGDNPAMKGWPRNEELQMYEINFDIALDDSWGLIMNARAESPFLNVKHLEYFDTSNNPQIISRNRAASGWTSLVRWRGTESLGLRYRTLEGKQFQLLIAEEWGVGPYDASDELYSNNAPDVNFVFQANW